MKIYARNSSTRMQIRKDEWGINVAVIAGNNKLLARFDICEAYDLLQEHLWKVFPAAESDLGIARRAADCRLIQSIYALLHQSYQEKEIKR